jgi:hypothetical protein
MKARIREKLTAGQLAAKSESPTSERFREHNQSMRYHKRQPAVERQCLQCLKTFMTWASLLRHGKRCDFCSRNCWIAFSRVTVNCDTCGKEISRQKKTASRYINARNFCSRDCMYKARRINPDRIPVKRLRYGSTEFRKARLLIIERDGVCQICGDPLANSIHHKDWKPYVNTLDNLVLLCKKHHGMFKRYEDWETGKARIMACSDLHGNMQSASEMPGTQQLVSVSC